MDATTYTGTGVSQTVVNQGQFKSDLIWIIQRSRREWNILADSIRGTNNQLFSNSTNAEQTNATFLTAFASNGFTVDTSTGTNGSGSTYVGWQWQAGQGTNTTNTNGSITSTVSVNATAGFSIVSWTATGSVATVGHGLGVAPKIVINRQRSTTGNWAFITDLLTVGTPQYMYLDSTAAIANTGWGSSPTSSVISAYSYGSGQTIISYCWAEIAGFSKFGSYTGNGSADGPFVYTGFRPKFVMIKGTGASGANWNIFDTSRDTYNVEGQFIAANLSSAEGTSATLDGLSNGFKIRTSGGYANTSAEAFIYMAFAENPFKNANAR
jgi:hypothetical protein